MGYKDPTMLFHHGGDFLREVDSQFPNTLCLTSSLPVWYNSDDPANLNRSVTYATQEEEPTPKAHCVSATSEHTFIRLFAASVVYSICHIFF